MQRIIRRTFHNTNVLWKSNRRSPTRPLPTDFFQKSLPTLPFPDIQETISAFLEQQRVVLETTKFQQLEKITNDLFEKDIKVLNQMLYEEYKHNKAIYGGLQCIDSLRRWRYSNLQQTYGSVGFHVNNMDSQLIIGSKLLHSIGIVQKSLRDNTYKPVMFKTNPVFEDILLQTPEQYRTQVAQGLGIIPFDMAVYRNTLSGSKLPGFVTDTSHVATSSKNVVVIQNGNLFSFDLIKENGNLLTTTELLLNLEGIVEQSTETSGSPIAALTVMKRDDWAEYRNHLLSNQRNAETLQIIEDAITILTLDGTYDVDTKGKFVLHGEKPGNRWFDKNLAFSIDKTSGLVASSSTSTETHASIVANVHEEILDVYETLSPPSKENFSSPTPIKPLIFFVDDKLREGIELAKKEFNEIHNNFECAHIESENFGRKQVGHYQLSPDSVMHVATQITFIKLMGRPQNVISPVMVPSFINSHYFVTFAPWKDTVHLANRYVSQGKIDLSALKLHSQKYVSLLMQMRLGLAATEPHLRALIDFAKTSGKGSLFFENDIVTNSLLAAMDVAGIPNEGAKYMVYTGFNGAMAFGNLFKNDKFYGSITSGDIYKPSPADFKNVFMEAMDDLLRQIKKQE